MSTVSKYSFYNDSGPLLYGRSLRLSLYCIIIIIIIEINLAADIGTNYKTRDVTN